MPRYDLYDRPWYRMTSPGASSVPANRLPIITVSAPAASALATSPEYLMPPSAMIATPEPFAAATESLIAVSCGTPTPATMRVVQIEPGPTPTFTALTPASMSALVAPAVATLPATSCSFGNFLRVSRTASITPAEWPCAVSTQITSQPAAISASM